MTSRGLTTAHPLHANHSPATCLCPIKRLCHPRWLWLPPLCLDRSRKISAMSTQHLPLSGSMWSYFTANITQSALALVYNMLEYLPRPYPNFIVLVPCTNCLLWCTSQKEPCNAPITTRCRCHPVLRHAQCQPAEHAHSTEDAPAQEGACPSPSSVVEVQDESVCECKCEQ